MAQLVPQTMNATASIFSNMNRIEINKSKAIGDVFTALMKIDAYKLQKIADALAKLPQ
jgi:hypothetical protein